MNQLNLDPVSVAIAVAGLLFGPALAGVIGPYAVIIMACTVGAGWALGRRDPGRAPICRLVLSAPERYGGYRDREPGPVGGPVDRW